MGYHQAANQDARSGAVYSDGCAPANNVHYPEEEQDA